MVALEVINGLMSKSRDKFFESLTRDWVVNRVLSIADYNQLDEKMDDKEDDDDDVIDDSEFSDDEEDLKFEENAVLGKSHWSCYLYMYIFQIYKKRCIVHPSCFLFSRVHLSRVRVSLRDFFL